MYLSWRIWLVYALLVAIAIPWYWRWIPWATTTLCMGMPSWAFSSVAASAVISLYTAFLLRKPWPTEDDPPLEQDAA